MADQLQLRGGSSTEQASFTGASREVTVDTTNNTLRVHDGTTAGGHLLAKTSDLAITQTSQGIILNALGVSANTSHLGTFSGSTLGDNISVKSALQALETRLEEVDIDTDDMATLVGLAENVANLGTFTGTTIADNDSIKDALQSLETATELRAPIASPEFTGHVYSPEFKASGTGHLKLRAETGNDLNIYLANVETLQITRDPSTGNPKFTAKGGSGEFKFNQAITEPSFSGHAYSPEWRATGTGHLKLRAETGNDLIVYLANQETMQVTRHSGTGNVMFTAGGGSKEFVFNQTTTFGANVTVTGNLTLGGSLISATAEEINIMDGVTATANEINILDGVTSTTAELNILDGVTSTTAELNILDGVTSTAAELNILDGVTSTAAELNILDGVTSTAAELNLLDGVTATTAELNYVDGVTSNVQTQLNTVVAAAAVSTGILGATPGTITAQKAVIVDSNKDITGFRNLTVTGDLTVPYGDLTIGVTAITATGAELNFVDGVTSNIQTQLDAKSPIASPTFTGTPAAPTAAASTNTTQLATTAFVQAALTATIDGAPGALDTLNELAAALGDDANFSTTITNLINANETHIDNVATLSGVAKDSTHLSTFTGSTISDNQTVKAAIQALETAVETKQATDAELTELATMASTTAAALADLLEAEVQILDGATVTTAELNILDGVTSTAAELNILDGVTSTAAELNILDGVTSTAAELNILDGVTSTAAELNILDGVTSTAAELNILDGVTSTAAELNILDGVTATAAELNYVDGVTSNVQTQLDAKLASSGAKAALDVDHLITLSGVSAAADNLGTFTGSTISDNGTVKAGIQELETAVETKVGAANSNLTGTTVVAAIDLSGDIDCDGTANLDAVDIDGDVDLAGDLTFSAAKDVHFVDNNAAALEFAEAGNAYLTFVTTDGSNAVKVSKNLDIDADDIDVSTQATDIKLIDNTALALRLVEGSTEYLRVTTTDSSEKIDVSTALQLDGAVDINGDMDMSGTVTFSDAQSLAITDNLGYALRIVEGGNEYVRFVTTDGAEEVDFSKSVKIDGGLTLGSGISIPASQDVTLVASNSNALDFVIASGNRMMRFNTSTETVLMEQNIDVGGTTNLDAVDIDGDIDIAGDITFSAAKDIQLLDNTSAALEIAEGANNYVRFMTTDSSEMIEIRQKADFYGVAHIRNGIDMTTSQDITFMDNNAAALDFLEGSNSYLKFVTTNGSESVTVGQALNASNGFQIGGTAVTSTAAELNILDGVTSTAAELNILDGVTSTAAELNILDGVTSTAAELNILDGVTASAADLNLIDGITNGTVIASKAIVTDANKDITGGRHVTITGDVTANAIKLGGTGSANTLSDYEEGTFTPTISSGLTSANLSTATGNYTKIGRLVHFNIDIVINSGTANSDNFQIGSLPFTANNDTGNFGMAQIVHNNILTGFTELYAGIIIGNTTHMSFKNGAGFIAGDSSGVALTNGKRIIIAGTYMA